MPVDRLKRDAAADALAAFMRGEMDKTSVRERLISIPGSCTNRDGSREGPVDKPLRSLIDDLQLEFSSDLGPYTEKDWERFCRILAFLKSDLEILQEPSWPTADPNRLVSPADLRMFRQACWHLLGLLAALGFAFLVGWWLLAAAWVVSFVMFSAMMARIDSEEEEEDLREFRRISAFYPFENEDQWLSHAELLEPYRLPPYDPEIHGRAEEIVHSRWDKALTLLLSAAVLCPMFAIMWAGSLLIWPLWLAIAALSWLVISANRCLKRQSAPPPP